MTNSIAEIEDTDCLFVIGSNTTEAHPVLALRMKKAMRRGAKLIVADPRRTWLAQRADIHLQLKPGTDIPLVNAMAHVILKEGLQAQDYIHNLTENYEAFAKAVGEWPPERAAEICGVEAEDIRKAARAYATTDRSGIYYTLGITEHVCGVDNVRTLSNLALATGHLGREAVGVNPLRGQNNVQGCNDMGNNPVYLPGYQLVAEEENRARFEKAWGTPLSAEPGLRLDQMMDRMHTGELRAFYVMGEDPLISEPNLAHVEEGFDKVDFVVSQDIFLNETSRRHADVVLPATCFAEKDGTFTNSERRVQRVRKAVEAPGSARPDLEIITEIAKRLGAQWLPADPQAYWDEVADLMPKFFGIRYDRIEETGLQWPCPDRDHPGSKFLHEGAPIRGKGVFYGVDHVPPWEEPDEEYPFLLTTGRTLYHYNAATQTARSDGLVDKQESNFIEIAPADARDLGVSDGMLVQVESRRGQVDALAVVTDRLSPGVMWMPMHFSAARANVLTGDGRDSEVGTPEYKVTAVRLATHGH
jgi:formate dehydrogenase major subunit/formate dehydrogenase alpha subunit